MRCAVLESEFSEGALRDQESKIPCISTDVDESDSDYDDELPNQAETPANNPTDATSPEDDLLHNRQYKVVQVTDTAQVNQ